MALDDLHRVNHQLNPDRSEDTHRLRLDLQSEDRAAYVVAWLGDAPVGHGMIIWDGPIGSPKQHLRDVCPYIEDLWVQDGHRRTGVGSSLMAEMEARAAARGHRDAGLSVGVDNLPGIRFYSQLGYRTVGIPRYELSGAVQSQSGEISFWSETCQYMRRDIADGARHAPRASVGGNRTG